MDKLILTFHNSMINLWFLCDSPDVEDDYLEHLENQERLIEKQEQTLEENKQELEQKDQIIEKLLEQLKKQK